MLSKTDFEKQELILDELAKHKNLTSLEGKHQLDHYLNMLRNYFCQINHIKMIEFDKLEQCSIVPINFEERFKYILQRRYHFMGYRQMKTLISELIKMNASYQTRQAHKRH